MMLQRIPSTPNMNKRTINKNNPASPFATHFKLVIGALFRDSAPKWLFV